MPFGGSGTCTSKRLLESGSIFSREQSSATEAVWRRVDGIGMRDLECELSREPPSPGCKGLSTAMWDSGDCATTPTGKTPDRSLLVLR